MMAKKYKKVFWWGIVQIIFVTMALGGGVMAGEEDSRAVQWYGKIIGTDTVKGHDVIYVGDSMFYLENSFELVVCNKRTESSIYNLEEYVGRNCQIVEKNINDRTYVVTVIVECNK